MKINKLWCGFIRLRESKRSFCNCGASPFGYSRFTPRLLKYEEWFFWFSHKLLFVCSPYSTQMNFCIYISKCTLRYVSTNNHPHFTSSHEHLFVHNINSRIHNFFIHTSFVHVHKTNGQKIYNLKILVKH